MKQLTIWAFMLLPLAMFAQKKSSIRFTNITQVGMLAGKAENVPSIQTINGISFNQTSIGIGVGYDTYGYNSIPVFLDARKMFGKKPTKFLLYADAGRNIPLNSKALPQKWDDGTTAYTFNTTWYAEAGFGISKKVSKNLSLNLTAGYSYKHFSYTEHLPIWYVFPYVYSWGNATYDYYYRRFSLRFGVQF